MPFELANPDLWRGLGDLTLIGFTLWVIERLTTRKWITRQTYDEDRADAARERAYVEQRRLEERARTEALQEKLDDLTERWDRALALLGGIEKELIRFAERAARDG